MPLTRGSIVASSRTAACLYWVRVAERGMKVEGAAGVEGDASLPAQYEGFPSATQRDAARRQRALLYQWRLLCSGHEPGLLQRCSHDDGLSFEDARRLNEDLRVTPGVLSWRELELACGHSLGHFLGGSRDFRTPAVETLIDMAGVGGAAAVARLLVDHKLSTSERRRLADSADVRAKALNLAPALAQQLPGVLEVAPAVAREPRPSQLLQNTTPSPASPSRRETASPITASPPRPELDQRSSAGARQRDYRGWEPFVGGYIKLNMQQLSTECLDSDGRWRDACNHRIESFGHPLPPYLDLLAGRIAADGFHALARDLSLGNQQATELEACGWYWRERRTAARFAARGPHLSSRALKDLLPGVGGQTVEAGYRLLRRLFFPAELQDGWKGPGHDQDLGRAVLDKRYGSTARPVVASLKVHVTRLDLATVYLHIWPSLDPVELLWGRVARDLWGRVLGYCRRGGGHWFLASPGASHCGTLIHWGGAMHVTPERSGPRAAALRPFPRDLLDQLREVPDRPREGRQALRRILEQLVDGSDAFLGPRLALSPSEIDHADAVATATVDEVLSVLHRAVVGDGNDPMGDAVGLRHLLHSAATAGPPLPEVVANGRVFPVIRLFSWLRPDPAPVLYGAASVPQITLEAAAAQAFETAFREHGTVLRWGPFWCARPNCERLFVSPVLQRDERACVTPTGYRSLLLSQYCSHRCFVADRPTAAT